MIEAVITEYSDFYSEWWGLEDGTILSVKDERGSYWKKFGDKPAKLAVPPWLSPE